MWSPLLDLFSPTQWDTYPTSAQVRTERVVPETPLVAVKILNYCTKSVNMAESTQKHSFLLHCDCNALTTVETTINLNIKGYTSTRDNMPLSLFVKNTVWRQTKTFNTQVLRSKAGQITHSTIIQNFNNKWKMPPNVQEWNSMKGLTFTTFF